VAGNGRTAAVRVPSPVAKQTQANNGIRKQNSFSFAVVSSEAKILVSRGGLSGLRANDRTSTTSGLAVARRLKYLQPAPDYEGNDPRRKYAEGYEFTDRMRGGWEIETIVRNIDSITIFHSCICGRL
jgi:hypothetical protein